MLKDEDLKHFVSDSNKKLAELIVQEESPEMTKLQSKEARQSKIVHELEDHEKNLEQKMHDGLQTAINALDECPNPLMSKKELVATLFKCFSSIESPEAFSEIGQGLLTNKTWKVSLGISDTCMAALYQGAKYIFDKKDYKNAEQAFYVLCAFDPTQINYWIGLGHCCFQDKNFEQAINAYSMVSMLNPEDVRPHIWAANTFEEAMDTDHAKMAFNCALDLAKRINKVQDKELIHFLENKVYNLKAA